ncbi:MAG: hypothetical protein ACRDOU_31605 [Streptosporangiaceae bacterium]
MRRYPRAGFPFARRTAGRVMLRAAGGRAGWRRLLVPYVLAAGLRCQASSAAGVTGNTPACWRRGTDLMSAADQARSPGPYRTRPASPAQHRVLVPDHQQLSIPAMVPAEHQGDQAKGTSASAGRRS